MSRTYTNAELQATLNAQLTPFARQVVAGFGLAGAAMGVVRSGELVYAEGFGVRDRDAGAPVTPQSLFHLASISKSFVATAVMQLAVQGKIALDAPIVAYLPYLRLNDPRAAQITIRQMLSHTSGMPDEVDYRWYAPEEDDAALERYVRGLAGRELVAAPGERFAYSNTAFEVLGDLIAKVSGMPFEAYVKTHVLDPLGMRDSTFLRREVRADRATTPHFGAPLRTLAGAYPYHRAHAPSSSLHSSVEEMSRWAIANMHRGQLDDARILPAASYDELWKQHVRTGEQGWDEATGLGWFFGTYRDHEVIYHNGSDPGFHSDFVILPAADAAVITLINSNTPAIGILADAAFDILLGQEPRPPPRPPITAPLGATLADAGLEAAIAQYHRLRETDPDRYDAAPKRFMDVAWGALEMHRVDAVLPLIHLCAAIYPDAAETYELLGWAQLIRGELQAADNLRRAVELDPENSHAAQLLHELQQSE